MDRVLNTRVRTDGYNFTALTVGTWLRTLGVACFEPGLSRILA